MNFFTEGFAQAWALLTAFDPETFSAVRATMTSTCYAMAASLLIGLPAGFALGYYSFPGRRALRMVSDTLLAFPTVLIGLLVYGVICRRGVLGDFGLLFTLPGMAIGQTILALPIIISLTAQAVETLDARCRQTLLTLGANDRQVAVATIRELRFSIMAVAVTAFGRVVTEVGIAMMLGGNIKWETRTITTAIALETNKGEFAQGMALGIVLLTMAFVLNFALSFSRRRDRA
ncbi:MAG: ABC transporter permease [Desulfovibrionaceae bacterium]|nr:ABC transporter permease [Desulfovibrionaceae bacterium]